LPSRCLTVFIPFLGFGVIGVDCVPSELEDGELDDLAMLFELLPVDGNWAGG